jgi:replicative DNA helicase
MEKVPLPPFMEKVSRMTAGGFPLGYIINIAAGSGVGKTTIVNELFYYWIYNSPYKLGIVSLEADVGEYAENLASRHTGRKISCIESVEDKISYVTSPEFKYKMNDLQMKPDGTPRMHLIDDRGEGWSKMQAKVEYLIASGECKIIAFDPTTDLFAGGSNEDVELFMRWQKETVKRYNVLLVNIHHVRKQASGQKAISEGASLSEEDMIGSGSIYRSGGLNMLLMRNKNSEDAVEKNTTKVLIPKCRWTGITGPAGDWYYDNSVHRIYDKNQYFSGKTQNSVTDKESIEEFKDDGAFVDGASDISLTELMV